MTALDLSAGVPSRRRVGAVRPGLVLAGAVLAVLVVAVVWPGLFAPAPGDAVDVAQALRPPAAGHLFGTDQLGRDIFARVVHGARVSLLTGLTATVLGVAAGTVLGLLAALGGRVADEAVSRTMDVLLSLPGLLLALIVIAVLGPGTGSQLVAIAVSAIPLYTRLVRGQALTVRRAEHIAAAVALGIPPRRVVLRHVLPNSLGPLLVIATLGVGTAIIVGSSLSFLGLGPKPPTPEWGAMLADGRDFISLAWWVCLFPGLAITVTVVSVTVLGRHLQGRFEGRP